MPATSAPASIAIAGGGIVGLAVALSCLERWPATPVTVYEKEPAVALHQSGRNSNVLHCGLYYRPGSLKARLAVAGIRKMVEFCQQHGVPHEVCGKLVVAVSQEEVPRLHELEQRGRANGLEGLRWLGQEAMRDIEPHVQGIAALHVPQEGITHYPTVCDAMVREITRRGGELRLKAPVSAPRYRDGRWRFRAGEGEGSAAFLVNCAGLHCDRLMASAGERRRTRIVPFRGEYFELDEEGAKLVKHLIYPVPDPAFPFLGVHFTRMIRGGVEAGPNAVLATAREGYSWKALSLRDLADTLSYGGFWRFFGRYPRMAAYEAYRSFCRAEFCRSLQRLVPAVEERQLRPGTAGVRAQALAADGNLVQDFDFLLRSHALHLINAPSPGATASLAIAEYLVEQIAARPV
jgi:L-2-hydroxyglutarate oxidase LhgO